MPRKKTVETRNTDLAQPAVKPGFRRVESTMSEFWSPDDDESGHPNPIEGTVLDFRMIPAHGKFPAQEVIDVLTEDGTPYTVVRKGNLKWLAKRANLGVGQIIRVEWLLKAPPSEKMPLGQHLFDLQVAE